jgi:hypothetical protein
MPEIHRLDVGLGCQDRLVGIHVLT